MFPVDVLFLLIALVLSFLVFQVTRGMGLHWAGTICLAGIPVGASLLFGMIGLLGSALFVGALYKSSAR